MDKQFWAMVLSQVVVLMIERHLGKTQWGSILGWLGAKLLKKEETK